MRRSIGMCRFTLTIPVSRLTEWMRVLWEYLNSRGELSVGGESRKEGWWEDSQVRSSAMAAEEAIPEDRALMCKEMVKITWAYCEKARRWKGKRCSAKNAKHYNLVPLNIARFFKAAVVYLSEFLKVVLRPCFHGISLETFEVLFLD